MHARIQHTQWLSCSWPKQCARREISKLQMNGVENKQNIRSTTTTQRPIDGPCIWCHHNSVSFARRQSGELYCVCMPSRRQMQQLIEPPQGTEQVGVAVMRKEHTSAARRKQESSKQRDTRTSKVNKAPKATQHQTWRSPGRPMASGRQGESWQAEWNTRGAAHTTLQSTTTYIKMAWSGTLYVRRHKDPQATLKKAESGSSMCRCTHHNSRRPQ